MGEIGEEEIKDIIEEILQDPFIIFSQDASFESTQIKATAIQGLLDLYNKEKEKNKELFEKYEKRVDELERQIATELISKDKIKDVKDAVVAKRKQEIEDLGMSMLGSAVDTLEYLLKGDNNE